MIQLELRKAVVTTHGSLPGKELLNRMIANSSDTPFARFMKSLGDTASDWMRDGHTLYWCHCWKMSLHCQQKLSGIFEAEIAAIFDAQYQQDNRNLGQFQTTYTREIAEIVRVFRANIGDVMLSTVV